MLFRSNDTATTEIYTLSLHDALPILQRSAIAAIVFIAAMILIVHQPVAAAVALGGFVLLFYVPLSYYTDLFFYRRRQAKELEKGRQ